MLIDTEETYVVLASKYGNTMNNIEYYGPKKECQLIYDRLILSDDGCDMLSMLTLQEYLDGGY